MVVWLVLTSHAPVEWLAFVMDVSENKRATDALAQSEERHRTVIETLAEGVIFRDIDGKIVQANASALRYFGALVDRLGGPGGFDPSLHAIREDGSKLPTEEFPSMITLRTGELVKNQIVGVRKPDGEIVWLEYNSHPMRDPGTGCMSGVCSSFFDITLRKNAERILRERADYQEIVNRVNEAVHSTLDPDAIQTKVAIILGGAMHLDHCFYVRYDEQHNIMNRMEGYLRPGIELPDMPNTTTLSDFREARLELYAKGTAVFNDLCAPGVPDGARMIQERFGNRAIIAVPYYENNIHLASLVASMYEPREWTHAEVELLERVAAMTHDAIIAADLVSREMNIAHKLQEALMPAIPDQIAGLKLASYYRPALHEASVGGDFADVVSTGENTAFLVIGDVSGKGLAAATQVAIVRNMLRYALLSNESLAAAVTMLNSIIAGNELMSGFVTLLIARYDADSRTLTYVNCGHEAGLIMRFATGQIEELLPTGTVLGAVDDEVYEASSLRLEFGDIFVAFTDGLTEAGKGPGAFLSSNGVANLIRAQHPVNDPHTLVHALMAGVDDFAHGIARDDQCLLAAMA